MARDVITRALNGAAHSYYALLACHVARNGCGLLGIALIAYLVWIKRFDRD